MSAGRRLQIPAEDYRSVGRDAGDIAVRNDDAVVIVHPLLRRTEVGPRIAVVNATGGDAERTEPTRRRGISYAVFCLKKKNKFT